MIKSYKKVLNSMPKYSGLRVLTEDEIKKLRKVFLQGLTDMTRVCEKYNLTVMLIGGSVLGAVRHQGFIPWDDDLDIAMTRADYNILKRVFEKELGDKYFLVAPNYKGNARNRFPQIFVKDTVFLEVENSDPNSGIKIDLFIIENIPSGYIRRIIKGCWCSALMFMASNAATYQENSNLLKRYMYQTKEGEKYYKRKMKLGRLFSFIEEQKWFNIVEKACQYNKRTNLMGIPTGRGHYFGEIRPRNTFLPISHGMFEGIVVNLPGNPDDYLSNLYGDYKTIPAEDKREQHFIYDIKFSNDNEKSVR
ncbi:MAG: LicD family protein [Oscillospiraceae bacterium]|nr:LicD family protein [Oscillospiraceae bacterium]